MSDVLSEDAFWDEIFNSPPPQPPPLFRLSGEELLSVMRTKMKIVSTVYRLEKDGLGPYTLNEGWQRDNHCPRTGRNTPGADLGFCVAFSEVEPDERVRYDWFSRLQKKTTQEYFFGFSSEDQLLKWFHDPLELQELFSRGYKISVYDNVEGFDSGSQVIFTKSKD